MGSLALIVGLIFILVIISGPATLFICRFNFIPNFIAYFLSIVCSILGIWWLLLPISAVRYLGIIPILCAYYVINNRKIKKQLTLQTRKAKVDKPV
jgi:hypothetical protein